MVFKGSYYYVNCLTHKSVFYIQMVTDVGFGYAQDWVNKQHMRDGNNVYYYILSYRSPQAAELIPEWLGI